MFNCEIIIFIKYSRHQIYRNNGNKSESEPKSVCIQIFFHFHISDGHCKKPISHLIKRVASNVTSNIMRAILPDEICYGYRVSNNRFLDGIEDHVFNGDVCRQVVKLRGLAVPGMRLKLSEITEVKGNRNIFNVINAI